ncbi:MAG: hypothetical protein LBG59_06450 [Candidatus Peribacteria bacterium]|jgi:hypothetical protein|nr:hypothetical protein [Candidatus Peribacteria bacterium]
MIRGTTYAGTEGEWYQSHLEALKKEGIMHTIDQPTLREARAHIFIILHRFYQKGYIKPHQAPLEPASAFFLPGNTTLMRPELTILSLLMKVVREP